MKNVHDGRGNIQNEIVYTTILEIACLNTVHDGLGNCQYEIAYTTVVEKAFLNTAGTRRSCK